ncbi:MAG: hemolysin family protein [Anaerolineales bacterium]
MIPIEWGVPLSILFVILDLSIAATRVSLLNLRPLRLLSLRDEAPDDVDRALALIEDARLRPTLRFSQTATRILLAGVILSMAGQVAGEFRFALVILLLIILLVALALMVVEFTVEGNILSEPERWGMRLGKFARVLIFVMTPLVFLPVHLLKSQWPAPVAAQMTEDELRTWVESEQQEGGLEREERKMIYSIFQFGDTLAREIMVPRMDMLAFEVSNSLTDATKAFTRTGHSRVPVYENNIDNIIGLLYAKDLLHIMQDGQKPVSLRELLRPAYFVPDTKKADALLTEMQAQRIHLAIVVDEYGGVAGLVTLEDIIEEIIGEIQDEYDLSEEEPVQEVSPGEYVFLGRIDLDDFNEVMDSNIPKVESDTLAGFLYDHFGRVPHDGESFQADGLLLTIEQVIGRRIRRVRAQRIIPEEKGDPDHAASNQ